MSRLKVYFIVLFSFCSTVIFSQSGMIEADNGVLKLKLDLPRKGIEHWRIPINTSWSYL